MSVKKKLGLGVASAALGLSLVGGGTWAAFNDTATINNHFAAGTLDLEVGRNHPYHVLNFDLANMKPGDSVRRIFKLSNAGSIAIKEVLLDTTAANFVNGTDAVNGGENTDEEYLSQFEIDFFNTDSESPAPTYEPRNSVIKTGEKITLADLVNGDFYDKIKDEFKASDGTKRLNLAPLTVAPGEEDYRGIPVTPEDNDAVGIKITFKNNTTDKNADGTYVQNKYQGDKIDFFFNLEATQWEGMFMDVHRKNGTVNNGVQGSSDAGSLPDPVTIEGGKYKDTETED
ncbi:TasA family protein [Mesobacillus sp. LC4]